MNIEYKILQLSYNTPTNPIYSVIGEGYMSFTASWMGVVIEVNRQIARGYSVQGTYVIERWEPDGSSCQIAKVVIDDRPFEQIADDRILDNSIHQELGLFKKLKH